MSVDVFTICWNERDLLPYFLRWYAAADRIVVWDNGSTDGSQAIVAACKNAELRSYDTNGQQDNLAMLAVKNGCWKQSTADWVIVCDVDELIDFWKLAREPVRPAAYNCHGWQMIGGDGQKLEDVNLRLPESWDKIAAFSPRIENINYRAGCHAAAPTYDVVQNVLQLRHYHHLGEEYVIRRYARYAARMSQSDIVLRHGWHYRLPESDNRAWYRDALARAVPDKEIGSIWGQMP